MEKINANAKSSMKTKLHEHCDKLPLDLFNPSLQLPGGYTEHLLSVSIPYFLQVQHTPVEILHCLLLGVVKCFWHNVVQRLTASQKNILKVCLSCIDTNGLGIPPLAGNMLIHYAGPLTGQDSHAIIQVVPLVLHGLLPDAIYKAWLALSHVVCIAYQVHHITYHFKQPPLKAIS